MPGTAHPSHAVLQLGTNPLPQRVVAHFSERQISLLDNLEVVKAADD